MSRRIWGVCGRASAFVLLATSAVSLTAAPAASQRTTPYKPDIAAVRRAALKITAADLMRDVTYIASDALRGRSTPSPGLDSAAAYVVRALQALKVKPGGDDGTYLQHYTVTQSTLDTTKASMRIDYDGDRTVDAGGGSGVSGKRVTADFGTGFVVTGMLTGGVVTGPVVYVGTGLRAPGRGLDPYAGVDVRGKWVLTHAPGAFPKGLSQSMLGRMGTDYTTPAAEARARGALGVLIIPGPADTKSLDNVRRRISGRDLVPSVGNAFAQYPLPQVMLSAGMVRVLLNGAPVTGNAVLAADTTREYAASFEIPRATVTVDLVARTSSVHPYNVVGIIEGSDPKLKEEYITVSSHLDGAVGRGVRNGDSIYNAADDNGTGSAGNIAIARALMSGPRPKRTILLIWDSGEESGLWGSRFMAHSPLSEKVVAHFTVDMIGRSKQPGTNIQGEEELAAPGVVFAVGPGILSTQMEKVLQNVTRDYGYIKLDRHFDDATHEFFYPRTDAAPYLERGIPYVELFTGLHGDYHSQTDEVGKLDPVKMEAVARTIYASVWTLADDPVTPGIDKPLPPSAAFIKPRR